VRVRLHAVTGTRGKLRDLCQAEGYGEADIFTIPDNVGERYAVFSPAGLLPAAVREALYGYGGDTGLDPVPALATKCTSNTDLTVWTCDLRQNVKFSNGAAFGSDDVITSFAAQWDTLNALHVGRTGDFEYWDSLIGQGKLNPTGPCGLANTAPCTP